MVGLARGGCHGSSTFQAPGRPGRKAKTPYDSSPKFKSVVSEWW